MRPILVLLAFLLLACPPTRQGGTPPDEFDDDDASDDDDATFDDDDDADDDDDIPVEPGFLVVEPSFVDFGLVDLGDVVAQSLRLFNEGDSEIFVFDAFLEGSSSFGMEWPGELVLFPGEVAEVVVFFEPLDDGPHDGFIIFLAEDGFNPKVFVELFGEGS